VRKNSGQVGVTAREVGVNDPDAQLQPHLRGNEHVIWSGRPVTAVRFSPADVFMVPFSIVWGVFALFWVVSLIANGSPVFLLVASIPFVAVGGYLLFGRFLVKRHRKLRTAYAITNQRALIAGADSLQEAPIKKIPSAVRRHRDGRHISVSLGNQGLFRAASFYGNTGMDLHNAYGGPLTFYDVADGEALLHAVDQARTSPADSGV
jgi:hypothetical protein